MEVNAPLFGTDVKAAGKRYMPLYTIDSGYKTAVQNWINTFNDPGRQKATIQFSSKDANKYSWLDVGHQEWKAEGGVKYLPFFSVNYDTSKSKDTKTINLNDQNAAVDVTISASGIQSFKITSGSWYV